MKLKACFFNAFFFLLDTSQILFHYRLLGWLIKYLLLVSSCPSVGMGH